MGSWLPLYTPLNRSAPCSYVNDAAPSPICVVADDDDADGRYVNMDAGWQVCDPSMRDSRQSEGEIGGC